VPDTHIAEILGEQGVTLESIARSLVEAANEGGGPDNITALILQIDAA